MAAASSALVCPELGHIYTLIDDELYSHPIMQDGTYDPYDYVMVNIQNLWHNDRNIWSVCITIRDTLRTISQSQSIEEGSRS